MKSIKMFYTQYIGILCPSVYDSLWKLGTILQYLPGLYDWLDQFMAGRHAKLFPIFKHI